MQADRAAEPDRSGKGMDRVVPRRGMRVMIGGAAAVVIVGLGAVTWAALPPPAGVHVVNASELVIATVRQGVFDDFVATQGVTAPAQSVFIDIMQGGRVEQVLAISGDQVKAGQLLVQLSNPELALDVIGRETQVSEQLNQLHTRAYALEHDRLANLQTRISTEAEVDRLQRLVTRNERLALEGAYPQAAIVEDRAALAARQKLLTIAREAETAGETRTRDQLAEIAASEGRLRQNLVATKANLDALRIRAPISGVLTSFDAQVGQAIQRGDRVGQIDSPTVSKVEVAIDQLYLDRFRTGIDATAEITGRSWNLKVVRVFSQVDNGQFKADLMFEGAPPASLLRGQSFPVRISLSPPSPATLLPNGPYLAATGGRWVYVVNADGSRAVRRDITVARRSASQIEVTSGLAAGDMVVVSAYSTFDDARELRVRGGKPVAGE